MKMKQLLIAPFVALLGVGAFCADAQAAGSVTGTVTVNGSVADRCLFTTDNVVLDVGEMAIVSGNADDIGRLDAAKVNALQATLVGWCNGTAATIAVEASPILDTSFTTQPPSGFVTRVDYTATAKAHPDSGTVSVSDDSTTGGGSTPANVGIFSSNVDVTFSNAGAQNNDRLVSGTYQGSVVVTLSPTA